MAIENDIVLIYLEDSPVFFARVESIWPDVKRDWFNIEMLMLQIPLKMIVWTLKDDYINGGEFFMDGKRVRMEVVEAPKDPFDMVEDSEEKEDDEAHYNGGNGSPTPLRRLKPAARRSVSTPSQSTDDKSTQDDKIDQDEKRGGRVISFADFQNRKKED